MVIENYFPDDIQYFGSGILGKNGTIKIADMRAMSRLATLFYTSDEWDSAPRKRAAEGSSSGSIELGKSGTKRIRTS